ncbi:hypothetical protein V6R21_26670 [Limibacter armeniacum]|uniref:hypothetical protein n=1 Tax=Limibacter armeniacum TaxID=466084 RepID=UPI002FE609F5
MKKILINTLLLSLFGLLFLQSCQQDPVFPDPGFEIGDQRVEIRRDTADYYDISMAMEVPNKVAKIEVLNALDYTTIEGLDDYNGQTDFQFSYRIDLTPFEQDTVLNYIVKVTDQDSRSFNQGVRLDVKRKSFPEIKLIGGTNIAVAAPAYIVKGLVSTGLNGIQTVKVSFEGEDQFVFEATADTTLYEMSLQEQLFLGNLESGVNYSINIFIKDSKGQESNTLIAVRKSDFVKKPTEVRYVNSSGALIKLGFEYNEYNNITVMDYIFTGGTTASNIGKNYRSEFYYNDQQLVDTLKYRTIAADGTFDRASYLVYHYQAGTALLDSITSFDVDYVDGEAMPAGESEIEADGFVYDETGKLLSFVISRGTVSEVNYSDPFNLGEQVFSEYWQSTSYMVNSSRRQHFNYDPVLMPTFMEGFPPIVWPSSTLQDIYNDLLWNKYIMSGAVTPTSDYAYLYVPKYTYKTDNDGNVTEIIKANTNYRDYYDAQTYTFYYD